MWLHQERKDPTGMFWFSTKNFTVNYNRLATLKTADSEEKSTQNFVFITHKRPTTVITKFSDFILVDSVSKLPPHDTKAKYVVIIPHKIKNSTLGLNVFEKKDQRSMMFLAEMLHSLANLDGATCVPQAVLSDVEASIPFSRELLRHRWREIFLNSSWCNFIRRDWSIQIRNRGSIRGLNYISTDNFHGIFQMCNIINGPVVLRKDIFIRIGGLEPSFGRLTLLEFFLRSKGRLKIGKFGNCILSDHLFITDRALLQESRDFPEYTNFGTRYGILRIIKEDRIEWTKCAASWRLCKERPYTPPSTLPHVGQPICCSVVLGKMLKDVTDVFVKLGIKHRVVYGTLLGAVRNKAIIPWTHDVDISLERNSTHNKTFFGVIQSHLKDKYYVGESMMGMLRAIPLMPAHINIETTAFFDGDSDLQGNRFFSSEIRDSVQELLPVTRSSWRTRGYMDFYTAPEIWWNGSSIIEINGNFFITLKEIDYELRNWYGSNYMNQAFKGNWMGLSDKDAVIG